MEFNGGDRKMLCIMPKRKEKTERLFAEIPMSLMDGLRELADRNDRTLKGELSVAIKRHLRDNGKLPAAEDEDE